MQIKKRPPARVVLASARSALIELRSIAAVLDELDARLVSIRCPLAVTAPGKEEEFPAEAILDKKSAYLAKYRAKYSEMLAAIEDAESLIGRLQNAGARSALRLYYLAGLPTWEVVADELRKDERTVRRWREMSFEILDKKYQKK